MTILGTLLVTFAVMLGVIAAMGHETTSIEQGSKVFIPFGGK